MAKLPPDVVAYLGSAPGITQTHESALQGANAVQACAGMPAPATCAPSATSQAVAPVGPGITSGHSRVVSVVHRTEAERQAYLAKVKSLDAIFAAPILTNEDVDKMMAKVQAASGRGETA